MEQDVHMHPQRAHSGGTCIRFVWDGQACDTVGWFVVPEKNDLVRCGDTLYRVARRVFDSDEPNCLVIECEPL